MEPESLFMTQRDPSSWPTASRFRDQTMHIEVISACKVCVSRSEVAIRGAGCVSSVSELVGGGSEDERMRGQ